MFHQNNKTAKQHQQCLRKQQTLACDDRNEARIVPEMRHGRETQLKM